MFNSLLKLADDLFEIVSAPIEIAVDTVRSVTKPLAEVATEAKDAIKEELEVE